MNLAQALRIDNAPCLALVGAGGKTSALFRMARELPSPVILTATTHLAIEQTGLADLHLITRSIDDIRPLETQIPAGVTLVTGPLDGNRTTGVHKDVLEWLHAICRRHSLPLLIEADGARQRPLKAPAEHEPPIPAFVRRVIVVAGLTGLGKPLNERTAYRPEIFAKLSGLKIGERITPAAIARVLTHPMGGLKNIPASARRVVLLNQADTAQIQAQAKELADLLLGEFEAVVVSSLNLGGAPVVHAAHEKVSGVILAAGGSTRFGQPKQLLDWHGGPFVCQVAQSALTAGLSPVVVVTGADAERVEPVITDLPVRMVHNADWQSGQSSSIRAGLACLPQETGAAIFLLVDQPQVTPAVLRGLVECHAVNLSPIVAPLVMDQRANPVLFDRLTFPDLMALTGDVGGRAIFSKYAVNYLPWYDESLLIDIDRPEDLDKLTKFE